MDPALALQVSVGQVPVDLDRGALDAGLLAFGESSTLDLVTVSLSPAEIHPQQHVGPVLRLGATRAGVNREQRRATIIWTAELKLKLEALSGVLA